MSGFESGWRSALVPGELHDVDEGRHEIAVDFPFDVLDKFGTDWRPGVWDESLRNWKPPMVWNHNPDLLIGATRSSERLSHAQRMVGRFSRFEHCPLAGQAYQQALDGEIPGYSFHYQQGVSEPHRSTRRARSFLKAHMAEWGPTALPSIPGADAVGIRSQEETSMTTANVETLRDMYRTGELTYDGYRSMMEDLFPEVARAMNWDGIRAATVQSLPHGMGTSLYQQPTNPSDGHGMRPTEHQHELGSRPPGAPTLDQILKMHETGDIDDDGKKALIAKYYPHLADHLRSAPPKSVEDVRAVLARTYGEEATRGISIAMPAVGDKVPGGSHDDNDDDGDNDAERELIEAINEALEAAERMSEGGDDEKRSGPAFDAVQALVGAAHFAAYTLADMKGIEVGSRAMKVSDEPWEGDASRFSPEQYRSSCLIDTGEGAEDSKDRYKLPVREPGGELSRRGVHAAAAALAGARSDLQASSEQKRSAARKLMGHYNTLGEKPPPSIVRLAGKGGDDGEEGDGGRSADDLVEPADVDEALTRLERRRSA